MADYLRRLGESVTAQLDHFRRLYDNNYVAVYGYAQRRTFNLDDADDVVGETFVVAWRRLDDVPDGTRTRPWLYGVARRVLANQRRGQRRREGLNERLIGLHKPSDPGPSYEDIEHLVASFTRLPEIDREVLLLVGWEGLAASQVGVVLGCSTAAARVRLHRARSRFGRELAAEGMDSSTADMLAPARPVHAHIDPKEAS